MICRLLFAVAAVSAMSDDSAFFDATVHCVPGSLGSRSVWCVHDLFDWSGPHGRPRRAANMTACATETFARQKEWDPHYSDLREAPVLWNKYLLPLTRQSAAPLYYLEIGGYDGVAESNTLALERCAGWNGVLVEGVRASFHKMVQTRSMAHTAHFVPGCAAHGIAHINHAGTTGANLVSGSLPNAESVHCGPLVEFLEQLCVPRIDFWSLDVEDSEQLVLDTMDFSRIPVTYLLVEVHNRFRNTTKQKWLKEVFAPRNRFRFLEEIGASWLFKRLDVLK